MTPLMLRMRISFVVAAKQCGEVKERKPNWLMAKKDIPRWAVTAKNSIAVKDRTDFTVRC